MVPTVPYLITISIWILYCRIGSIILKYNDDSNITYMISIRNPNQIIVKSYLYLSKELLPYDLKLRRCTTKVVT